MGQKITCDVCGFEEWPKKVVRSRKVHIIDNDKVISAYGPKDICGECEEIVNNRIKESLTELTRKRRTRKPKETTKADVNRAK